MRCLPSLLLAVAAGTLAAGCDLSMKNQPRNDRMESPTLWPGGPQRAPPPAGTVAFEDIARDRALAYAPPITAALLERGQQRYAIYCSVCHGERGEGDGIVVRHGFPAPPSYHTERLRDAPPRHIVDVITDGYGVMYSYADRVPPTDRWAIAAYVKTLQVAGPEREAR
ncbi:c-type cytochrome [Stakelama saccharophila]|uniref:Cytochrome c n=1 Tax=Stakelama saccharophila TaxID=3075605 RepID=A0ABZ0B5P2_9SPHN|nr:cytochrome c [Stakelama sp. W311]WNO52717.1 cytochrome c [Stakelama sp. W311]